MRSLTKLLVLLITSVLFVSTADAQATQTVVAWGYGRMGQLGDGSFRSTSTPVAVRNLTRVTAMAAHSQRSLAITDDGSVWTWGDVHDFGDPTIGQSDINIPILVPGVSNAISVAAGCSHSLALKADGTVWTWGSNLYQQLGRDDIAQTVPAPVEGLMNVVAISAGCWHSLALDADGAVWAWGQNDYAQLARDPALRTSSLPQRVTQLTDVLAIAAGDMHNLALKSDGTVWAWGYKSLGQLSDGSSIVGNEFWVADPVQVKQLSGVIAIAAGSYHGLALTSDHTVWGWGSGAGIGDGISTSPNIPVPMMQGVTAIFAGGGGSLVIKSDHSVWAWGDSGLTWASPETPRGTPIQKFNSDLMITGLAIGSNHSLAFGPIPVQATINTSPAGLAFQVDGAIYNGEHAFSWYPGTTHQISAVSPQPSPIPEAQWVMWGWSDGGARDHTVAPNADTTYTANFVLLTTPQALAGPQGPQGVPGPMGPAGTHVWSTYTPLVLPQSSRPVRDSVEPIVVSTFTPNNDMRITRVQAQAQVGPAHCLRNAVLRVSSGTNGNKIDLPITAEANDTGLIGVQYVAGEVVTLSVKPPVMCKTPPSSINVVVQYHGE